MLHSDYDISIKNYCKILPIYAFELKFMLLIPYNQLNSSVNQTQRNGGGHIGPVLPQVTACAPQTKIVPPKRGLCPEEIKRLGALERKSRPKLVFFVDLHKFLRRFWDEDLFFVFCFFFFFWRSPVFGRKNYLKFRFRPKNPLKFQ